jgi:glycogen debranching enzyme
MDNLPRQSPGCSREFDHGHLSWIDATAQQALSCEMLMKIAAVVGETDIDDLFEERESLRRRIQAMWDPRTKFFYDTDRDGNTTGVMTIGSYWVMLAGLATKEQAAAMTAHLFDPDDFFTPMVVPGLAAHHPERDDDYWRGGVWAPTTYMGLKALERYGFDAERNRLARLYVDAILREFNQTGILYEVYASRTGAHQPVAREHFVGWTGLAPITIVIEDVFGIRCDGVARTVEWRLNLEEPHGIDSLPIGDGLVSVFYDPERGRTLSERIRATSSLPLCVVVRTRDEVLTFPTQPMDL